MPGADERQGLRNTMDRPGFATGLLTGLGLGMGMMLLLALAFPPFVFEPPDVDAAIGSPPLALPTPKAEAQMPAPDLPEPLVSPPPDAARLPGPVAESLIGLAPQVAPDVFEGNPAGSPSLVPTD